MFNLLRNSITFSPKQIKIFVGTMLAMFLIVALQLLGVRTPKLVLPTPQKADIFFENIVPKLEQKANSYRLQNNTNVFPIAEAAVGYEAAAAYAVTDFDTGEVLASKNISTPVAIASLTKIMTAVVALDLADPSELFTVSERAAKMIPTKIGARTGEQLTLDELLHASLMTSANDAVEVIREGIDIKYRDAVFIRAMNEKARFLGLNHSSFTNPQGFDNNGHYSSVEDLAVLTRYALVNYPKLVEIAKKDYALLPQNSYHKRFDLYNWNGLLGVYPETIGLKIGNTDAAGKTTIVVSERMGKKLIAVVLGATGIIERDLWAAQLLDTGYAKIAGLPSVDINEEQLLAKYRTWKFWN